MPFCFGDILWLTVAYTDGSGSKRRPVVVVSSAALNQQRRDVAVIALTSKQEPFTTYPGELLLEDWQAAGLSRLSAIKPVFVTYQQDILPPKEGALSANDKARLRAHLPTLLG